MHVFYGFFDMKVNVEAKSSEAGSGVYIEHRWQNNKSLNFINPEISYGGFVTTNEFWRQEPIYASFSRLYFVLDGSGVLVSENEKMILEPGYVYLAPCGMKCGFYGTPSVSKVFFHVNLGLTAGGSDVFESIGHFMRLPRSNEMLENIKKWYLGGDVMGHLMLKGEIMRCICEFLQTAEQKFGINKNYSKPVATAISYARMHLAANLTVSEIAEAALCSKSNLSALFRKEVGQSVAKYIDDLLMSEAQTMLLYSEKSVGQISERLGFCDQFYFSRWFCKRFGVSPKQYKRSVGKT
jgi:AraC-like DNA-binding protein